MTTFDLDEYVHAALRNGARGFLLERSGPGLLVEAVRAATSGDTLIGPQVTVRLLRALAAPPASGTGATCGRRSVTAPPAEPAVPAPRP